MACCHHPNGERAVACGGEQHGRKRIAYLFGSPVALSDILPILEPVQNLHNGSLLFFCALLLQTLATNSALLPLRLESLLCELDILQPQLLGNDVQVTHWVDVTLDVNDLSIIEAPYNLENGIDRTDVRQEGVTQTSTSRRTTGQSRDIVDGQVGGDSGLGVVFLAQPVVPRVWDNDAGLFWVDGGIGKVGWVTKVALGDGLEEGGFADVCKANLN